MRRKWGLQRNSLRLTLCDSRYVQSKQRDEQESKNNRLEADPVLRRFVFSSLSTETRAAFTRRTKSIWETSVCQHWLQSPKELSILFPQNRHPVLVLDPANWHKLNLLIPNLASGFTKELLETRAFSSSRACRKPLWLSVSPRALLQELLKLNLQDTVPWESFPQISEWDFGRNVSQENLAECFTLNPPTRKGRCFPIPCCVDTINKAHSSFSHCPFALTWFKELPVNLGCNSKLHTEQTLSEGKFPLTSPKGWPYPG